jgi:hypothetical protein
MAMCVHVALALRLKSKIWDHLYWYLQIYDMIFVPLSFGCLPKNTRLCKNLKTSKISLFYFRLYFVIVGVSSTMYYLLL